MRRLVLVIGEDPWSELWPFSQVAGHDPWLEWIDESEIALMAERFGIQETELERLCERMPDWSSCFGEVHEGRLARRRIDNPNAHFDYCYMGEDWGWGLRRKDPAITARVPGPGEVPLSAMVLQARKEEIDVESLCARPPAVYVIHGEWNEWQRRSRETWGEWSERFRGLVEHLPAESLLTIMTVKE